MFDLPFFRHLCEVFARLLLKAKQLTILLCDAESIHGESKKGKSTECVSLSIIGHAHDKVHSASINNFE